MSGKDTENKLFIGGLHLNTSTEGLRDYYAQWGEVADAIVMKDPNTKRSRGFGFVTYEQSDAVKRCMDNRPHNIDGREVEAKLAVPKEESNNPQATARTKKVFLGGLHLDTSDDEIREVLSAYGAVDEIVIKTDPDSNKPRGFGFAIMESFDAVDLMCEKRYLKIHDRDVEIKKAQSAEELRRKDGGRMGHGGGGRDRNYDMNRMGYGRDGYSTGAYPGYSGYGYPRYGAEYYPQGGNPYGGMRYPYGDGSPNLFAQYRQAYDNAAAAAVPGAYGAMYNQYASGYGPMRGYSGGEVNGSNYQSRSSPAGGRGYHPYKR